MLPEENASITIEMMRDERDQVNKLAHLQGFQSASAYVRFLLEEDAKSVDFELKFSVDPDDSLL